MGQPDHGCTILSKAVKYRSPDTAADSGKKYPLLLHSQAPVCVAI